jgi:hypothetical protein
LESDVAAALELLVNRGRQWDETAVEQFLEPEPLAIPQLNQSAVQLGRYDQLLVEFAHDPV